MSMSSFFLSWPWSCSRDNSKKIHQLEIHFLTDAAKPEREAIFENLKGLYTVWKLQDFSVTQILREINFTKSRSQKSAILVFLEGSEF